MFTGPFELTAFRNGRMDVRETEQIATRVKYIRFDRPAPPRQGKAPKACSFCWSRWVLYGQLQWMYDGGIPLDDFFKAVEFMAQGGVVQPSVPPSAPVVPGRTAPSPVVPVTVTAPLSSTPVAAVPLGSDVVAPTSGDMFHKLSKLIEWRCAGHLSEPEFAAAKNALGLN